ncbi:hypothetical protein [Actinomadura sp. WMMA1423]|uniref:hypothetical protein n=1 Tax=Actinomadura sp. WMMA1423 TaxID=2591108 RepID=UPI0011470096|nr:hypothetical protein [Actinomadura sp. WMMA1423]
MTNHPRQIRQSRGTAVNAVLTCEGLYSIASGADRRRVATALGDVYDVAREMIAPLYVRGTHRMLADLRAEAARGALIVLLGRDAQNIGEGIRHLDPALHKRLVEVRTNRPTIASALADLRIEHGRSFPELDRMLGKLIRRPTVSTESMAGASENLITLLRRAGLPVDDPEPPHDIILVDNGLRGTTRAALKAMYWPDARATLVRGFYLFRAAAYDDPCPHADRGYLFDLEADACGGGNSLLELPDDPHLEGLTFRNRAAITMLEVLTSGPELTPDRIDAQGDPVQRLYRDAPLPEEGIDPGCRSARFFDSRVYEGVLRIVRWAIGDCARYAAFHEQRGGDVQELLRPGHEKLVRNARAWAGDPAAMHPVLREVAGTYCWRPLDAGPARTVEADDRSSEAA